MARPAVLEDVAWPSDAMRWVELWAASGVSFTADDLRQHFRPAPEPNQVGAVFKAACERRLICPIGYQQSTAPSRNGAVIRVWRGVPHELA